MGPANIPSDVWSLYLDGKIPEETIMKYYDAAAGGGGSSSGGSSGSSSSGGLGGGSNTFMPNNSGAFSDLSYLFGSNGLNGYADGMVTSNPGMMMNTPGFQNSMNQQAAAWAGLQGQLAQAGAARDVGLANANANVIGSNNQKEVGLTQAEKALQQIREQMAAQKYATDAMKALGLDTNKTNYNIADITTLRQLLGLQDTNQSNQNIAETNIKPSMYKTDVLAQYLGVGGGGAGGSGGAGAGGLGGGSVAQLGGSGSGTQQGQGGSYAPVVPAFQSFSDVMANKQKAAANSDIATQAATQNRDFLRSRMGAGGMAMRGGVQDQMGVNRFNAIGNMVGNNTKIDLAVPQYNAQNAQAYAQMGLQQYNAEQDRANRLQLAKTLNPGTVISALA